MITFHFSVVISNLVTHHVQYKQIYFNTTILIVCVDLVNFLLMMCDCVFVRLIRLLPHTCIFLLCIFLPLAQLIFFPSPHTSSSAKLHFSIQFVQFFKNCNKEKKTKAGLFNGEPSLHLLKYSLYFFLAEFHRQCAGCSSKGATRGSAEAV